MTEKTIGKVRGILFGEEATTLTMRRECYNEIVQSYYSTLGFQFASLDEYLENGMIYVFHGDLGNPGEGFPRCRRDWVQDFRENFSPIEAEGTWDIVRDAFHGELLDTKENRERFQSMILKAFPHAEVLEYNSKENAFGSDSMRYKVFIPYTDAEKLLADVLGVSKD